MKSCSNCKHYGCVKSDDKLNQDKTITKGKLLYQWCNKGDFYLDDLNICDYFKALDKGEYRSARIKPPPLKVK